MPWSKAGLSIGMGLLILASLAHAKPLKTICTPMGAATAGLLVPLLISALLSEDLARGWKEWTSFWPLLFPFLGAATIRDSARPHLFLSILLCSTTAATIPLIQHLWENYERYGDPLRRWFIPPTNIWLYTVSICTGAFVAWMRVLGSDHWRSRLSWAGVFLLHLAAIPSTRRRMLILLACAVLAWITTVVRPSGTTRRPMVLTAAVLAGLLVMANFVDPRLQEILQPDRVLQQEPTRPLMWSFAWDEFSDSPLLGTGLGDLRTRLHEFADQEEARIEAENLALPVDEQVHINLHHSHLHSNFLHTLAVAGLAGLAGLLSYLVVTARALVQGMRKCNLSATLGWSAWALFFLGGVTDASLYSSSRLSAFTLVFAYAWGMLLRPEPATSDAAID